MQFPRLAIAVAAAGPLVASVSAVAGTIRHDVPDSSYIELAADPAYASVGALMWQEGDRNLRASGVLIDHNWVLTAAHVVDGNDSQGGGMSNMRFVLGPSAESGTVYYADMWVAHPKWATSGHNLFSGYDIGLVHLAEPVIDVRPASRFTGTDDRGLVGTYVGYGRSGTGLTGFEGGFGPDVEGLTNFLGEAGKATLDLIDLNSTGYGTKRAGRNMIDAHGGDKTDGHDDDHDLDLQGISSRIMFADFDRPDTPLSWMGGIEPLDLEYLIAPGDSGGGVFVTVNGETFLAGIHSFIAGVNQSPTGKYGDVAGCTRVEPFAAWIDGYLVPLPGAAWMGLAVLSGLVLARARHVR